MNSLSPFKAEGFYLFILLCQKFFKVFLISFFKTFLSMKYRDLMKILIKVNLFYNFFSINLLGSFLYIFLKKNFTLS
jgi:hypothetical protein